MRQAGAGCWPSDPKKRAGPSARSCLSHRGHHSLQFKSGSAEGRSRCDRSVSKRILRKRNKHYCSMRVFPAWPMVMPARAPLQTLLEGIESRFPRLFLSSRLLARSGRSIGRDVSAGPPTGYITHPMKIYPKKGSRRAHSSGTTRACVENLMLRNLP